MKKNIKAWMLIFCTAITMSLQSCMGAVECDIEPEAGILLLLLAGAQQDTTTLDTPMPEKVNVN